MYRVPRPIRIKLTVYMQEWVDPQTHYLYVYLRSSISYDFGKASPSTCRFRRTLQHIVHAEDDFIGLKFSTIWYWSQSDKWWSFCKKYFHPQHWSYFLFHIFKFLILSEIPCKSVKRIKWSQKEVKRCIELILYANNS